MNVRANVLLAVSAIAGFVATDARADDGTGDLEALLGQSIVSTASKSAETASTAPAMVTTITADDLRRYGIRSLNEAINYLSLGMVTSNPLHAVEIGARGVMLTADYGNHVLLLVNGHALNEQWNGTAYFERGAGIPFELIDHIEVILGPGSVLYGSNAMLGVINIVTKRAKDYRGLHLIGDFEVATSLRAAAGAGYEFRAFGEQGEITTQIEYYAQSGPTFSFGPQEYGVDGVTGEPKRFSPGNPTGVWGGEATNSYYTQVPAAYARLILGRLEVNARASIYRRGAPYLDGLTNASGDFNAPDNNEVDRFASLDVAYRATLSNALELKTRIYGDSYDYQWNNTSSAAEDCLENQLNGCRRHLVGAAQWGGIELQPSLDWFQDGMFVTMVGMDARVRRVQSQFDFTDPITDDNPGSLSPYDVTDGTLAVYGQQIVRPVTWLALNAGVRGDLDPRFDGVKASPRAALAVFPWDGGAVKAIYSEAFRAPSAYESNYHDPNNWATATDLKPESVRGVEGSIEQRFGTQRMIVGVFRSWWRDMVLYDTLTPEELAAAQAKGDIVPSATEAFQYQNVGAIDSYGWSAGYDGSLASQRFRYGLNVTGAYSRRTFADGTTLPLTVGPSFFGNARLSYDFAGLVEGMPTLAIAGQLLARRPADRAFDGGWSPPPFAPLHPEIRGTISGPFPAMPGMSYRVTADYAFVSEGPYVIGANQYATATQAAPELSPVDRFRLGVGLQYDFLE